ncbi:helix-turn-helix domain-containing protein [Shewanella sp. 4t3-1-2LB]|uniref:DNA-3-methyladenine glycosylase 2 family protein n=1 Tax=Shewanella sp. 4t3-1-2LB TaxID=2817682 RepID=UPI001A99C9CA|nr:AlkA N-terminal domain-containing protein [Shewanella sp. 4t3-1-2LB]MBO1271428.1 helix-turn-helix domain-containing protein [Shewanella sp. 4t3-1-2LB]
MSISCLSPAICRQARLSRDPRFDGRFFVGVHSTGIYCRPVCPAVSASERNVQYFASAAAAAAAGLRPCLRCRPESAPGSSAWRGTRTTLERAMRLIEQGALNGDTSQAVEQLAQRLGISSRWLRKLFNDALGTSPLQYAIYCRLLFAKQLLHETSMPVTQIALACGFNSIRRFNEVFQQRLQLPPTAIRHCSSTETSQTHITLFLSYRPPYAWQQLRHFLQWRSVADMEWFEHQGQQGYGRTLRVRQLQQQLRGWFFAVDEPKQHRFRVEVALVAEDSLALLPMWLQCLRQILDLDAEPAVIHGRLSALQHRLPELQLQPGLRLPGCGSVAEAGIRAILGQQVSVKQATKLLRQLLQQTGENLLINGRHCVFFPEPTALTDELCATLPMPQSRQQTLLRLARYLQTADTPMSPDERPLADWLTLKGIGPWTVAYAAMRGLSAPDILLSGDLVVRKQLLQLLPDPAVKIEVALQQIATMAAPWGSYLTLNLWQQAVADDTCNDNRRSNIEA